MRRADAKLYEAKASGRNRVAVDLPARPSTRSSRDGGRRRRPAQGRGEFRAACSDEVEREQGPRPSDVGGPFAVSFADVRPA